MKEINVICTLNPKPTYEVHGIPLSYTECIEYFDKVADELGEDFTIVVNRRGETFAQILAEKYFIKIVTDEDRKDFYIINRKEK